MTIHFVQHNMDLLLVYHLDEGINELDEKFKQYQNYKVKKVFTFWEKYETDDDFIREDNDFILENDDETCIFKLGTLNDDGYYCINKDILDLKYDLWLSQDIEPDIKMFRAERDISVFKKLDKIIDEQIIVGGNHEKAISIEDFQQFIKKFPTTTELNRYAGARVEQVLSDYFATMSPEEEKLSRFLNKKLNAKIEPNSKVEHKPILIELEIKKFEYIYQELEEMLKKPSKIYTEAQWQNKIIDLIKLIFPKYIAVFSNVTIKDNYTKEKESNRYLDLLLVDFNGNIDILELKKPFENKVLSNRPSYRDNYVAHKELSGAIMQAEKYIFHLNKGGKNCELQLNERFKDELPENFTIKITNPKAIILTGRSHEFDDRQRLDFEIIKRQYSNISDIMTYDDLLYRVGNILESLRLNSNK